MAARYRATGAGNLVGGDFYDIFEVTPGSWGLVLGDVAGFGPEAAALTGVARYTVRAIASAVQGPADVLAELNDAVLRQASSDRFLTAIFASIEPQADHLKVSLAVGGHPPPLVLRDDETVEWVEGSHGSLLGVFPDPVLVNQQLVLRPGDAVVLYTDGVIEARNENGEEFGSGAPVGPARHLRGPVGRGHRPPHRTVRPRPSRRTHRGRPGHRGGASGGEVGTSKLVRVLPL